MRDIFIACDNAGVDLKNILRDFLLNRGLTVEDLGCNSSSDDSMYPHIASNLCEKLIEGGYQKRGILICGTGIGMCMTANKFPGIRAAVAHDSFSAKRSILSNNGNVLCMGARVIGAELAKLIVEDWVSLEYIDGPSTPKVQAICEAEAKNFAR